MEHFDVLDVHVSVVQIPGVVEMMKDWIAQPTACRNIAVTGMHGVIEAQHSPAFLEVLNSSDLVVPDGMPLVWLGRRRGFDSLKRRVYGPELMATFLRQTTDEYRHFLYGGTSEVAQRLSAVLQRDFGSRICGAYSPPFRPLTRAEEEEIVDRIESAGADIVWVGLSTPKQELWMSEFKTKVNTPILVGVGAAFDFLAGSKTSAPVWMQESGLEWLFRLATEPRRLWRRYLVSGSEFAARVTWAEVRRSIRGA